MKNLIDIRRILLLLGMGICLSLSSCADFLNVDKELAAELSEEDIFNTPDYCRKFHRNIMSGTFNSSYMFNTGNYQAHANPWPSLADELKIPYGNGNTFPTLGYNSSTANASHRWEGNYQLIRQANLFLEKAHTIIPVGDEADRIDEAELKQLKAQALFYRAYYHYMLFELYGPVPIMTQALSSDASVLDFPRNTVDEVVTFIDTELTKLISGAAGYEGLSDIETDQSRNALPSKAIAMALRAKLRVYAASPLYNGGNAQAMTLTNKDGSKLFPAAVDNSKWQKAVDALKEFIDFAEKGNYELYKEYKDGVYDPDESLYQLFMSYNSEVIWANSDVNASYSWGTVAGTTNAYDRRCTPRSTYSGWANMAIVQELVDDFYMTDGKKIEDSPLYSEVGFTNVPDRAPAAAAGATLKTYNMWVNREPRFYQTVFHHQRRWHLVTGIGTNAIIQFNTGKGNDKASGDHPRSGYLCYKRVPRNTLNTGSFPKSWYRPPIIFRLAEFYLLYAEALNEVNPSNPLILTYINKVRERAGIPNLEVSYPGASMTKEYLRDAIQHESRVELATEGQRYFDVRRWLIAEREPGQGGQGGKFTGMDMIGDTKDVSGFAPDSFFKRTTFETRIFEPRMYLYPIPLTELLKSNVLVQNPGW